MSFRPLTFLLCLQHQNSGHFGTYLVVQWLALHTFTEGDTHSIPSQGTKILQAVWCNKTKQIKNKQKNPDHLSSFTDIAKKDVFFPIQIFINIKIMCD